MEQFCTLLGQIPEMTINRGLHDVSVENTNSGLYITYTAMAIKCVLSRFVLVKSGGMQVFTLLDDGKWSMFLSQPRDQCAVYGVCGAYGNSNNLQFCSCVEG
uniref:S-locus glycoprotein family protein n=1 Tax=Cryptomeria japonica TaxID=3369 RepID=A0A1V1GAH3_CRYJA|nr:S-locus glycoprotein family protein [Cryptomeria japonica]